MKRAVVGILVGLMLATAGATTPAPATAKQTKAAKAKAPRDFFGVVPLQDPSAGEARAMSTAGVKSLRLLVYWAAVEPSPGTYDWSYYDSVIGNIAAAGLTPATQFASSPGWISSDPARPPIYSSAQVAAWQSFLSAFARRYGHGGRFWAEHPNLPYRPVTSWEIWNEPNLVPYWGGPPNARDYLGLVLASRQAIRAVDPAARIVLAGLFPYPAPGFGVHALQFLGDFYANGGTRKTFDVLSLHPYSISPGDLFSTCRAFRKFLNRHGSRRIAIWITELGWSTSGKDWSTSPYRATEPTQARYLTRSYKALIKARRAMRIQRIFWFSWRDSDTDSSAFLHMGLLRADGSPKPSYYAYRRLARR